ncbi:cupin domain-containing protein [Niallia oryzisoli]|uniref:Cupin domain-containing protein n=1 Tax=Niallia oryzisoli TaxID=1737571 RepID=A0ABZ2C8C7_9BACI
MYYIPNQYPYQYRYPYYANTPIYSYPRQPEYWSFPYRIDPEYSFDSLRTYNGSMQLEDHGPNPYVVNINQAAKQNNTFRTALWTGTHFQVTLMSLNPGEDIGLEIHPEVDQFLRIEQGQGIVQMGKRKDRLNFKRNVYDDFAIVVPAGTWHNVTNTGTVPLKLYSIYAPPNHPFGTVHNTKADAAAAEEH